MLDQGARTERVIGLAIEVHRLVGPGLLESVYRGCLCLELDQAGIVVRRVDAPEIAGVDDSSGVRINPQEETALRLLMGLAKLT